MDRYEKATAYLGKVQSGKVNPSLPVPLNTDGTEVDQTRIIYNSNLKRNNQY
jgi:hypothetical protein